MHKKVVFMTYVVCDFGCKHFQFLKKHEGPVHTYPNIFENGDFFLRIWKNLKNPRPIL